MGLRNREPEPLRNGRQSSSGSYWNRGISAHGCAGFSPCISIVAGTGTHRIGILPLPGTYREGHSRSVCVYCVISLGTISLLTLLVFGTVLSQWLRRRSAVPEAGLR